MVGCVRVFFERLFPPVVGGLVLNMWHPQAGTGRCHPESLPLIPVTLLFVKSRAIVARFTGVL